MANVRDSDIGLWLHNKLGSSESWTSGSISSQLSPDVLRNIKECFIDLQTQVKLKLLLSFFHIPRRSLEEWKGELEEILEVAMADSEQWVAMLAEIMKPYPSSGCLNYELTSAENEDNRRIFQDLVAEVTSELKNAKELNLLPLECHYLNKNALVTVVGQQKPPVKHFNLRRKSKSAILRAELLQKAAESAKTNMKKIPAPTIPLRTRGMPRKMTDTTPLKGIPTLTPNARTVSSVPASASSRTLSRTPAGKKEGGVKLLEITEQPVGFQMQKRRKKQQEMEEAKKPGGTEEPATPTETPPDYAAGLNPTVRPPTPPPPTPLNPPPTPSPFQPPTPQPAVANPPAPVAQPNFARSSIPDGPPPTPNPQLPNNPEPTTPTTPLIAPTGFLAPPTANSINNMAARHKIPLVSVGPPTPTQPLTKTVILQVPTSQTQQIVTLSKELMEQAQEIFRTANKATRPEKEHILKFMAGTRENPCPELGSIVTIKLSEHEEQMRQKDGNIISFSIETHFQMNYKTGEWKVIQKPPKIDNALLQQQVLQAANM